MLEGTMQDLIDRLEVATSEQDVLYVLVVLHQRKESGSPAQAINSPHSWKRQTALESIDSLPSQLSTLHRLIAQLLLLQGARYDLEKGKNEDLRELVAKWEQGEREEALDAEHLLTLDLEAAANWIDSNLPIPPKFDALTGEGPLPAPPSDCFAPTATETSPPTHISSKDSLPPSSLGQVQLPLPQESCSMEEIASISMQQSDSDDLTLTFDTPGKTPSPRSNEGEEVEEEVEREEREKGEEQEKIPNTAGDRLVQLHLNGLPVNFTLDRLKELFAGIDVPITDPQVLSRRSPSRPYAFVTVKASDAKHTMDSLHYKIVDEYKITCCHADSQPDGTSTSLSRSSLALPLPPKCPWRDPSSPTLVPRSRTTTTDYRPPSYRLSPDPSDTLLPLPRRPPPQRYSRRSRSSSPRRIQKEEDRDIHRPAIVTEARQKSRFSSSGPRKESTRFKTKPAFTKLALTGLPLYFDPDKSRNKVEELFAEIGVEPFDITTGYKDFAFLGVKSEQAEYCCDRLSGKRLTGGTILRCRIQPSETSFARRLRSSTPERKK
ncbi:uncharacterized protein JCM6883_005813 [Sporobolomyces salmoneus]|uniref:uncharacterized protein n=1 Tax=Sporobolomyces salmoneus TaxID=183962 RepID=UPI00316CDE71